MSSTAKHTGFIALPSYASLSEAANDTVSSTFKRLHQQDLPSACRRSDTRNSRCQGFEKVGCVHAAI